MLGLQLEKLHEAASGDHVSATTLVLANAARISGKLLERTTSLRTPESVLLAMICPL